MSKYEPIGYVAGVESNFNGYVPIVHLYQPGRPPEIVWAGSLFGSVADAMTQADQQRQILARPPSEEDLLLTLRRVLFAIAQGGNVAAITHHYYVQAAHELVAKLGFEP